jgi:hypothetical protein
MGSLCQTEPENTNRFYRIVFSGHSCWFDNDLEKKLEFHQMFSQLGLKVENCQLLLHRKDQTRNVITGNTTVCSSQFRNVLYPQNDPKNYGDTLEIHHRHEICFTLNCTTGPEPMRFIYVLRWKK